MEGSVLGSRRPPPPSPAVLNKRHPMRPRIIPVCCNKCRKPLSTTVFVCSCDCLFCEECTHSHFSRNSQCPTCRRMLTESDFTELVVADPCSATQIATKTAMLQKMFTKRNAKSRFFSFFDLCDQTLQQQDDSLAGSKFLKKQFLIETTRRAHRFRQLLVAFQRLKNKYTAVKQAKNSEKLRYEKYIENLRQQLAASNKKNEEKDRQLHQYRKMHDVMTQASPEQHHMTPAMGASGRFPRDGSIYEVPGSARREMQASRPPMQGFLIQKQKHERAQQSEMGGTPRPTAMGKPINPYTSPRSRGSQGSGSSGDRGVVRDLMNSGFPFSGGATKRQRTMPPAQAFTRQVQDSFSASRGPSSYIQQGQGYSYRR